MWFSILSIGAQVKTFSRILISAVLLSALLVGGMFWGEWSAAIAGLKDDRYDGDIFALYAGNGSLVLPRFTLKQAFERKRPALLVFYVDDSRDCKQYATVVSRLQAFYGRAADFIALRADALLLDDRPSSSDPEFYYTGVVPQTVLFDAAGNPVLNQAGILTFERVDDVFREVFDLLPRSQSVELKRRSINEISTELSQ